MKRQQSYFVHVIISVVMLSGLLGSLWTSYAAQKSGFTWWIDSLGLVKKDSALTKMDLFMKDSLYLDSIRVDSISRVKAREDSMAMDTLMAVFLEHADSLMEYDSLYAANNTPEPRFQNVYYVPDSLLLSDTLRYRYFQALLDSAARAFARDSLRAAGDSIIRPQLDSMILADSLWKNKFAFDYWYANLTKSERREYEYMEKMKRKIARQDSVWAIKDSLKAVKDSIVKATPRVLDTYIIPDSLQYKRMILWTRDRNFSDINVSEIDTSYNYNFYDLPYYRKDVEAVNLGMPGSPLMLDNFFKREETENAFFYTPYAEWSYSPETLPNVNTKTPYTEFFYSGSPFANKDKEEGNARIWTSTNITPALNMNFMFQNWGGAGVLNHEKTNNRTAFAALNHVGRKYVMHAGFIYNRINRNENGGLVDSYWIRDTTVDAREIAVHLNDAATKTSRRTFYVDQSYRIPLSVFSDLAHAVVEKFSKKALPVEDTLKMSVSDSLTLLLNDTTYLATIDSTAKASLDSLLTVALAREKAVADSLAVVQEALAKAAEEERLAKESLDASSAFIGHNSEWTVFKHTYTDKITPTTANNPYQNFYLSPRASADSMKVMKFENKVYIRLQPWSSESAVAKLDVGLGDKLLSYYAPASENFYLQKTSNTVLNSLYAYAGARGQIKKYVEWDALAKYTILGYGFSDLEAKGNFRFSFYPFRQRNEPVNLTAKVGTELKEPDYYQQHFFSNHLKWDNDFGKISTTKIEGGIDIPKWKFSASAGYGLLGNNLYYSSDGMIHQNGSAMSVFSLAAQKDFTLWNFHFENRGLFQLSSNQEIVPLPTFVANLRWYFQMDVVKDVMQLQLGANARYTTQWYAPSYNAVTGQFVNQNLEKYGDCPVIDLFVNAQWVRTCVFIKVTNVGNGWPMERPDYFSSAGYIYPQRTIRFGIMWPFYTQSKKLHSHSGGMPSGGGSGPRLGGGLGGLKNALNR